MKCAVIAILVGCRASDPGVMVFVAASAAEPMVVAGVQFEAETGVRVVVNAAGSSILAQQIAAGADADLFLSANVAWCEFLEEHGAVENRVDLIGNELVLIVPSSGDMNIASPHDLLGDDVELVAVADTESVPAGQYAKQALSRLGLWEEVERKLLPGADVRQALVYVERGEADAGIVYATDASMSDKVRVAHTFGEDSAESIVYPLVLTSDGSANDDARRFYEYLQSQPARLVFESQGFNLAGLD